MSDFLLIRPFAVTDAALTASDVVETPPAAYNAGTTYAAGDRVSVLSGTVATVYESLQAGNTGNTPASSPLWWMQLGTAYSVYSGATSYSEGDVVTDTTGHRLYESLQNANSGNALSDASWWLDIGPTNRWAPFDQKTGTQVVWASGASWEIDVTGNADSVALLNLDAASVNITVMDGATEMHNQDYSLVDTDGIADWYSYFFEPITRKSDFYASDLPNVLNPTVTVTLTDSDSVSLGTLVVGMRRSLGKTQYGASVGIVDFSRKTLDDFGNYYIVERSFSKRGKFTVWMEKQYTDQVFRLLSQYRATPVAVVAAQEFSSTFYYGLLKDWNIELTYVSHSVMTIEMEGL